MSASTSVRSMSVGSLVAVTTFYATPRGGGTRGRGARRSSRTGLMTIATEVLLGASAAVAGQCGQSAPTVPAWLTGSHPRLGDFAPVEVPEYRQIERVKGADTPGAVMRLLQQPTVAGPSPAWRYREIETTYSPRTIARASRDILPKLTLNPAGACRVGMAFRSTSRHWPGRRRRCIRGAWLRAR